MISECVDCDPAYAALEQAVENLGRYLSNNQTRVDDQRYLEQGLMIGSGVVESSS